MPDFPCSSALENLAAALVTGARMELELTPKPGLVDRADNGSHPDLSFPLMERSIRLVARYLEALVVSLRAGEPFASQKAIALVAEQRLHTELRTNTHKGFIFLTGMLLIAFHQADARAASDECAVRKSLSAVTQTFFDTAEKQDTHGERARQRFLRGGIVREAIHAYPSLFEKALPAFRNAMKQGLPCESAAFAMLAALMQSVDDTTTLHRGGLAGLERIRQDGRRLEDILFQGEDHLAFLEQINREYRQQNLTLGGVADLLGLAFGWLIFGGEIQREEQKAITRFGAVTIRRLPE